MVSSLVPPETQSGISNNAVNAISIEPLLNANHIDEGSGPTSPSSSTSQGASGSASRLLPIPTPSSNNSQTSFVFPTPDDAEDLEEVPPEIAAADISIAADGSYVETTSGPAAHELKKRYDHRYGVKNVPSPYAITAMINQHGKPVFRLGLRANLAATTPNFPPPDDLPPATNRRHQVQSRVANNSFSAPHANLFKSGGVVPTAIPVAKQSSSRGPARSPPTTRKLRKSRSNPHISISSSTEGLLMDAPQAYTGRTHSHSVTGADRQYVPVPLGGGAGIPRGDVFSSVMGWGTLSSMSATSSSLTSSSRDTTSSVGTTSNSNPEPLASARIVDYPFGQAVSFEYPARHSSVLLPPVIREMRSFDSVLTARAEPSGRLEQSRASQSATPPPRIPTPDNTSASLSSTIPNGLLLQTGTPTLPTGPSMGTQVYTRYPTDVFTVIQTYSGLPMLDSLSEKSSEPTIKLTLASKDTGLPRDDPRFVIWGELHPDGDDSSYHGDVRTDVSSSQSGFSRRKGSNPKTPGVPELRLHASQSPRRILAAAKIERWIAQLTSQYDYEELLVFFLTYRTYISAIDLCQLLICRFHWALEEPTSRQDAEVRRIVQVRTFVAIKYWLLTFFRVDFLPNALLCSHFANWLNSLKRDPILKKMPGAKGIVNNIIKVAKACKEEHTRRKPVARNDQKAQTPPQPQSNGRILGDLSNGNFAVSLRNAVNKRDDDEQSDVDLNFNPEESSPFAEVGFQGFASFANQLSSSTASHLTSTGTTSKAMLSQPLHVKIFQHGRGGEVPTIGQGPGPLPTHHSTLSRVVVNTIGRLGRWKRVLRSRALSSSYPNPDIVDLELSDAGDRLVVQGGVAQYLKIMEPLPQVLEVEGNVETTPAKSAPIRPTSPVPTLSLDLPRMELGDVLDVGVEKSSPVLKITGTEDLLDHAPAPAEINDITPLAEEYAGSESHDEPVTQPEIEDSSSLAEASEEISHESRSEADTDSEESLEERTNQDVDGPPAVRNTFINQLRAGQPTSSFRRPPSYGSSISFTSELSYGQMLPPGAATFSPLSQGEWRADNDYEMSDSSSNDGAAVPLPPGLVRPARRLPLRRDFEFVQRPDSVSSLGIISHPSVVSQRSASVTSSTSSVRVGGGFQPWQLNALIDDLSDDVDAPGDVEAALRRLEGQINPQRQRAKEAKVNGWVKTIQQRMMKGDFGDEDFRGPANLELYSSDEESDRNEAWEANGAAESTTDDADDGHGKNVSSSSDRELAILDSSDPSFATTPTPHQTSHFQTPPTSSSPPTSSFSPAADAKPKIEEAVPSEILESRLPRNQANDGSNIRSNRVSIGQGFPMIQHHSFVLSFRSEDLAKHFAVIDREIFLGIKFEELVSADWLNPEEDLNILDWSLFLRQRRRKVEARGQRLSVLVAARARFNLVSNFVVSEIMLTHPHERVVLANKFIRIAWKAYTQNNFATLVAIISGIYSPWVRRGMQRSWHRIGIWEMRVLEDLRAFSTSDDDFKYIRQAITAIADAKPLGVGSQDEATTSTGHTDLTPASRGKSSVDGKPAKLSCIPFIGVYLSQMLRYSKMPDLIDPSAPNRNVAVDVNGDLERPAYPEVFSALQPLPPFIQLEPLINVQKQRLIAGVIRSLVAGQHLANNLEVNIDKKLLQRCLKLRALDPESLSQSAFNSQS